MNERSELFDRQRAQDALIWMQENGGLNLYGWTDCLDRLSECVLPDPRIARIEALDEGNWDGAEYAYIRRVRAILRGDE